MHSSFQKRKCRAESEITRHCMSNRKSGVKCRTKCSTHRTSRSGGPGCAVLGGLEIGDTLRSCPLHPCCRFKISLSLAITEHCFDRRLCAKWSISCPAIEQCCHTVLAQCICVTIAVNRLEDAEIGGAYKFSKRIRIITILVTIFRNTV